MGRFSVSSESRSYIVSLLLWPTATSYDFSFLGEDTLKKAEIVWKLWMFCFFVGQAISKWMKRVGEVYMYSIHICTHTMEKIITVLQLPIFLIIAFNAFKSLQNLRIKRTFSENLCIYHKTKLSAYGRFLNTMNNLNMLLSLKSTSTWKFESIRYMLYEC